MSKCLYCPAFGTQYTAAMNILEVAVRKFIRRRAGVPIMSGKASWDVAVPRRNGQSGERQPTLASPPCPIQFSALFCMMAEIISDHTLPAVLTFILGVIVGGVSIGSFLLTLFAVIGIHI